MSDQTRIQAMRKQIRATSRDAFLLGEMKRLGFWPKEEAQPSLPEELITQEVALTQDLRKLLKQQSLLKDKDKLLNRIRKERMKASRERQKANRAKRLSGGLAGFQTKTNAGRLNPRNS